MDYDDYNDYGASEITTYITDFTEDERIIRFFETLAESSTEGAKEASQFNHSSSDMEKGQDALSSIESLYEEYHDQVDFIKILEIPEKNGGEDYIIYLEKSITYKVYRELMLKEIAEYNPHFTQYINDNNELLLHTLFRDKIVINNADKIKNISNTEALTEFLIATGISASINLFQHKYRLKQRDDDSLTDFTESEQQYINHYITEQSHKYYQNIFGDPRRSRPETFTIEAKFNEIIPFLNTIEFYKKNEKNISQNTEFNLGQYSNVKDLHYAITTNTLIELNKNNINEGLNFRPSKINQLQNHLLNISKKEILNLSTDLSRSNIRRYNQLTTSVDTLSFSNKIIETFTEYKKYEALFKNHKSLPEDHPLYFNIFEHEDIEKIDDFFKFAIERNQIKLYAKRFLGSYLKLMNENSYDLFRVIKEKCLKKEVIRSELQKIALFKDSNTLNNALFKLIELNSLSALSTMSTIESKKLDVDVIKNSRELLIVVPNNFNASSTLGSNQWCISNSAYHFNRYSSKEGGTKHAFIYDFTRTENDPLSKIAITVNADLKITDAFNKNNRNILTDIYALLADNTMTTIMNGITYLQENNQNYLIFKNITEKEELNINSITNNLINPIDFYNYLLTTDRGGDFLSNNVLSTLQATDIIKHSFETEPNALDKISQFKVAVEMAAPEISLNVEDIIFNYKKNKADLDKFLTNKNINPIQRVNKISP